MALGLTVPCLVHSSQYRRCSHEGMDIKKTLFRNSIRSDMEPQHAFDVATCGNVWLSRFQSVGRIRNKTRGKSEVLDGYLR